MSWKSEIAKVVETYPQYTYDAEANQFYSTWKPFLPLTAFKFASPIRGHLHIPPGSASYVILQPTIYRWLGIKKLKLVLGKPKWGHLHGDLSGTRNVIAAGKYTAELQEPKKLLRRRRTHITTITNSSGHYQPDLACLDATEIVLRAFNIPLSENFQKGHFFSM